MHGLFQVFSFFYVVGISSGSSTKMMEQYNTWRIVVEIITSLLKKLHGEFCHATNGR